MKCGLNKGAMLSEKPSFVKKCTKILKTIIDNIYYK